MYQVSTYILRPNTEVDFVEDSAEILEYVQVNYIDTGKVISFRDSEFVDDEKLIMKRTTVWTKKSDYDTWMTDPIAINNGLKKQKIAIERGITVLYKEVKEI